MFVKRGREFLKVYVGGARKDKKKRRRGGVGKLMLINELGAHAKNQVLEKDIENLVFCKTMKTIT